MNHDLVFGRSRCFRKVIETVDRYARVPDWPVLILGETGVGKELIARRLHSSSGRASTRFLPVNCGALPPSLFESELFGYERGAFSGAVQSSPGILRQARDGTVFLDEIGELDLALQVKLLRFLDSGELRSVGSTKIDHVQCRILAATNVDLYRAARAGSFRPDLERLSVLTVQVPALRERREDIPELAAHLIARLGASANPEVMTALSTYDWPGNVRQLRNLLIRASVRGGSQIGGSEILALIAEERLLKGESYTNRGKEIWHGSLAEIEKQVIVTRLKQLGGNRKRTAKELGIAKSTLHEKLRRWKSESGETLAWPLNRWNDDRWDDGAALRL